MNKITKTLVVHQSDVDNCTKNAAYPLAKIIEFSNELGVQGFKVLSVQSKDFNFLFNGSSTTYVFECVSLKEYPELTKRS